MDRNRVTLPVEALLRHDLLDLLESSKMIFLELGGLVEDVNRVCRRLRQQRLDLLLLLRQASRHFRQSADHVLRHRRVDERFQ